MANPEHRKRKRAGIIIAAGVITIATGAYLISRTRAKMESIQCANTLSSLGLAARLYAQDYHETFAPDLKSMSNELSTPKILLCPGDKFKLPALSFSSLTPSHVTYEYLVPGMKCGFPQRALFRCPVHGYMVLEDGSVLLKKGMIQHGKFPP
jgi:hypothetical protein